MYCLKIAPFNNKQTKEVSDINEYFITGLLCHLISCCVGYSGKRSRAITIRKCTVFLFHTTSISIIKIRHGNASKEFKPYPVAS